MPVVLDKPVRGKAANQGADLRRLRRNAKVSADDVAKAIAMTPTSLRARERGEREWLPEQVEAFIEAVKRLQATRSTDLNTQASQILPPRN